MSESLTPAEPLIPAPAAPPVATAPEPAPIHPPVGPTPVPEPVAAPAVEPAPAAAEPPKPPDHTETPTLLTPEPKPPEEAKPAEEPKPAEPTEPLAYEPPTLPDGVKLDPERLGAFDKVIGTHRVPPEARQELVNMFLAERKAWEAAAAQHQNDTFATLRREWRDQVAGDEQLGGAAMQTTRAAAMRMIDQFVAPAHRKAFDQALVYTGMGDHPEMIRFLANVARKFDAPVSPTPPNNPPPDAGRRPRGNGTMRLRDAYDHPRSPGNR